jgi:tetratricopeptide (TPR) repeat protein
MSKSDVLTRKDMKEPDKFQQAATQAASWIAARRRRVVAIGAAAVAVVVLVAIASAIQTRRAEQAGAAGADLMSIVSAEVSAVPLPGFPGPFFKTDAEKQRAIVQAAERVMVDHGGTPTASLAALAAGNAHLKLGEWDAAKAAYERYLASAGKDDSLRFGALEGIGLAEEGKGTLDAAAAAFDRLGREVPAFADRADLDRARVLAAAGKASEAKELLAKFPERHKESQLGAEASERLARLGGTK